MTHAATPEDLRWCWLRFHVPEEAFADAVRNDLAVEQRLPPAVWIQLLSGDAAALWPVRVELAKFAAPPQLVEWLHERLPDEPFGRFLDGDGAIPLGQELRGDLKRALGGTKFEKRRLRGELFGALNPDGKRPADLSLARLRLLVLRHWDPLGAAGAQQAPRQYDLLLPWIKNLLDGKAPVDELAAYLREHAPSALSLEGDVHARAARELQQAW